MGRGNYLKKDRNQMNYQNVPNIAGLSNQGCAAFGNAQSPVKSRGINDVIAEIGNELAESVNSSANLADKLGGPEPCDPSGVGPEPTCMIAKLEMILSGVRRVNSELNRAHRSVNG